MAVAALPARARSALTAERRRDEEMVAVFGQTPTRPWQRRRHKVEARGPYAHYRWQIAHSTHQVAASFHGVLFAFAGTRDSMRSVVGLGFRRRRRGRLRY